MNLSTIKSEAVWSGAGPEDSTYRYKLRHEFPTGSGAVLFIMMNPSYATEHQWDNTVRRAAGYATDWGYKVLYVGNIFAFRTPFPKGGVDKHGKTWPPIWDAKDPIGPGNDTALEEMLTEPLVEEVVCAWGNAGEKLGRGAEVRAMIQDVGQSHKTKALRINKSGEPAHPLYLPKDVTPVSFFDN